jgi:hypothetical protein
MLQHNMSIGRQGGVGVWLALALLAPALASCTTNRAPRIADVSTPAGFEAGGGGVLPQASLDRWWTLYGDPELEALVEQALVASPTQRLAAARVEEARAVRQQVQAGLYPQGALEGSASVTQTEVLSGEASGGGAGGPGGGAGGGGFNNFGGEGSSRSAGLNFPVSWELDLFGRRRAAVRTADADLAAARFNAEATRAQLAADVADSLFQARGLATRLEDAEATVRIQGAGGVVRRGSRWGSAPGRTQPRGSGLASARRKPPGWRPTCGRPTRAAGAGRRPNEPTEALALRGWRRPPPQPRRCRRAAGAAPDVGGAGAAGVRRGSLTQASSLLPALHLCRPGASQSSAASVDTSRPLGRLACRSSTASLRRSCAGQEARTEQAVLNYERAVQNAFSEAERTLGAAERRPEPGGVVDDGRTAGAHLL